MRRQHLSTCFVSLLLLSTLAAFLLISPSGAQANTRTGGGGDLPYYARIEQGEAFHNDEWAAIIFYRPTECVPPGFNLLVFYDFENAFGCTPPTTDGFIVWDGEPGNSNPIQIKLQGLGAVPVWFVSWPELQAAMANDYLDIGELAGLPSLMTGSASFYNETLHPTGAANNPMINFVARGELEDGQPFFVHAVLTNGASSTQIVFR